jgi:hypothetical protein
MAELPSRTKINVIIPSIGQPHFETKLRILRSNLIRITADGRGNALEFFAQCFLYTPEPVFVSSLLATLQEYIPASNIILHVEPGYLGSFIYRYVKPDAQRARFDYLFFILDDIELSENFHMTTWLECYHDNNLDVLSPSVAEPGTSQLIMKIPAAYKSAGSERGAVRGAVRRVNFCEFFCYLMTVEVYMTYFRLFNDETQTMWGIDLLMHPLKLKMGLHNDVVMTHHYGGNGTGCMTRETATLELNKLVAAYQTVNPGDEVVWSNYAKIIT